MYYNKKYNEYLKIYKQNVIKYEEYLNKNMLENQLPEGHKSALMQQYQKIINEMREDKSNNPNNINYPYLKLLEGINPMDFIKPNKIKIYPGSDKGPHPEDDPEHFEKWCNDNMTIVEKKMQENFNKYFENDENNEAKENDRSKVNLNMGMYVMNDSSNIDYASPDKHEEMIKTVGQSTYRSYEIEDGMDFMPEELPIDWQVAVPYIERWSSLRVIRQFYKYCDSYEKEIDRLNNSTPVINDEPSDKYYPTLLAYYNILPKFIRDDPLMITTVRGLEKHKGEWSFKDKIKLVNEAAMHCLDKEPWVKEVLPEYFNDYKHFATAEEEIRLMAKEGCLTGENGENQSKNVDLLVDKLDYEWDSPRKFYTVDTILDKSPATPLEYYDNDDGFWDDYIKEKNRKRGNVEYIKNRQFFMH